MKIEKPINANYCATVVRLKNIIPLANCDNVVGTSIFGYQAIVGKEHQVGDIGIVFPPETQLSDEFAKENNLFRHSEFNKDIRVKGYLEDNKRIRAMKFRGNRSEALFMPLESLQYLKVNIGELKEGDEFDQLDGEEICRKYVIKIGSARVNRQPSPKTFKRVDTKYIPEHFDSDNYFKFCEQLNPETEVIVTQKIHGTSIRIANTIVLRKLNVFEKLLSKFGVKIQPTEFDYVFGSRKVIKDANNPLQKSFYDIDLWSQEGKKLEGTIPENYILYGELVGWTPTGAPIQKGYTYQVPLGTCQLYIYRVAFVNGQGILIDLSWDHVLEFCDSHGLKPVVELWRGKVKDFDVNQFLDKHFNQEYRNALPLEKEDMVDEGICVRVDKMTPYILKAKSPKFLEHESKMLDFGEIDLETEGSSENGMDFVEGGVDHG